MSVIAVAMNGIPIVTANVSVGPVGIITAATVNVTKRIAPAITTIIKTCLRRLSNGST